MPNPPRRQSFRCRKDHRQNQPGRRLDRRTLRPTGWICARRDVDIDPPDTPRFASYFAVNLIWEPIDNTTMGIEYLYGTNRTKDESFGFANRIQISVQYNFP